MSSSKDDMIDYSDDEGSPSNLNNPPTSSVWGNDFHRSDNSALPALPDTEDEDLINYSDNESVIPKEVAGPEFALRQLPGQGPEFQHVPGPGPESLKVANEVEMTDVGNPTEEPAPESLKPVAAAPEKTDKKVDDKAWCGPCKNRTGNGFAGHWTKSCPFAAESGFMEACARCGNLDHCVSFCPRLTWNGKKQVKIKDLYFYLVTCRKGLPPAIAEVDPRVIDPERWEKEVDYPQTPELARQRRQGVLNGTQPEKCDLNLWNELDVNTGEVLGPQIHPAHAHGNQHRCCDAVWYHPSQIQENTGSTSQSQQPSSKGKAGKDTTDSVLHGTIGGRIAKVARPEIPARGRGRGLGGSDRGRGLGRGREIAPRGGGSFGQPDQAWPAHSPVLPSRDEINPLLEFDRQEREERVQMLTLLMEAQTKSNHTFAAAMSARQHGPVGGVRDARSGGGAVPRRGGHGLDYPGHLPSRGRGGAPTRGRGGAPTRGRGGAPTRGYLGKKFLSIEERRARASQSGSQTFGQGGQQSLPPGLPALTFGEQGLPQRSARPAQAQGGQSLPPGLPALTFGEQGLPQRSAQPAQAQGGQNLPYGLPALTFGEQGLPLRSAQPAQAQGGQNLPAGPPYSTFGAQGTPHQNPGNPGGAPNQQ
ncbi:hypothetical protein BELL_0164g00040 [Botrytis elliptica]|uniref:Uncharacterized protein n=1 Tax=Botrytis elliptica TaxID=278938 RepID=A0A4Z1JRM5_9HELO|nr:hypothetical protein EAE99_009465 [Botrytis elliptica]TGO76275.1 hypothetical protein BELL_0164g00040 [Botrytis elliptica]